MKNALLAIICSLAIYSCAKNRELSFAPEKYRSESCSQCPEILVEIPKILDKRKISKTINSALTEEVISLLSYEEVPEAADIPGAIESFKKGYRDLLQRFPDESAPWEANVRAVISYENKDLISLELISYIYTGGAHGYGSTRYLNFDKNSGEELEREDLFKNESGLRELAEKRFRIQEQIPEDQSINSTGFMFEMDEFYLPENIGFTRSGLKLLYNPYEVASYADGSIELTLPFEEVKKYLSLKL